MKAWQKQGVGLENLKFVEVDTPKPGPKQLLVRVKAVSLNFRDKAIVDGIHLPELMSKPFIPVSDAAGIVVSIGSDVTRFHIGDRVPSHLRIKWIEGAPNDDDALFALGGPKNGGLAEYLVLDEDAAVMTPSHLTDEEASTLPIAALTVWFSLVEYGKIKAGDTVVVQGNGAILNTHVRNTHRGSLSIEFNGTEGDLLLKSKENIMFQMDSSLIKGAQGSGKQFEELPLPPQYNRLPSGIQAGPAFNVARLYTQIWGDLTSNTHHAPDFRTAAAVHRLFDQIRLAATGTRQKV